MKTGALIAGGLFLLFSIRVQAQPMVECSAAGGGLASTAYYRAVLDEAFEGSARWSGGVRITISVSGSEERLAFFRTDDGAFVAKGAPDRKVYPYLVERDKRCLLAPNPWEEAKNIPISWERAKLKRGEFEKLLRGFASALSKDLEESIRRERTHSRGGATQVAIHYAEIEVSYREGDKRLALTVIDDDETASAKWAREVQAIASGALAKPRYDRSGS